ncbi:PREDICTED: probable disease resistance protein At5g66900 isoform X2 [Populus euphratica]|uniref:Probable disease resistance protein At5g66900 isoform X2 n=1 Tax=Populus euphratica TaxID=75702 RepID=A0AAJ6Y1V4_POPEU|nr:PREDICTED: probable disease resistance protein At5g66900 isoform X2 [Populus euphratica]
MAGQVVISAVAGAGFEIIFGDFLKIVVKAQRHNSQFKPSLKRLEEMLKDMAPNIKRIESFNRELDQPKQLERLKGLMTKGNDLVNKCSKIHKYNCLMRPIYNKKLLKLEKDIRDHISRVLQLQVVADTKESLHTQNSTLVAVKGVSSGVRQLNDQFEKLSMTLSNGGRVDSSKSYPLLKVDPVGLEIPLSDLEIKLLNDPQHIVLSAPGGCGKTTLATALCQQGSVKDKFKSNIFFVNVPKQRNLMIIVKMIFQHKEIESPDFQSEADAANHLERLFMQIGPDPILLVLDDVWPVSESILDVLMFRIENYKILVTSRYEFQSFGSTYQLKTLNLADAMTLFQKLAFPLDQQSYTPDQQILEKMVKCCRGFPLVISVVGKSLCRKSAAEWRKRLRECSKAVSILSDYEKILDCLRSSVEALNDNVAAKECFMDLGSFPEDQRIPATTLIDMWAELYNLDEDDTIANLHKLSEMNLIEILVTRKDANEDDGSYNEHFVTQHDLLRELAIRESNSENIECRKRVLLEIIENKIPEWLMEQDQLSISAKLLSISTDENFSSSWSTMQAPEVEVLLLNFQTEKFSLPEFIERMDKLRVLVLHNYGFVPSEMSNFPLLGSLSNLKRIRLEKVSIPSLFLTSMKWRKLEKMSLVMCNIHEAFNKSTNNISDAFPKIVDLTIDYCNDLEELPTGFCDLVLLRKLSITNCHKLSALPEDMGNLLDLEVLRLNSCIELTELPATIGRLRKLQILDISECLSVTKLPEQIGQLHDLRKLYMIDCSSCELPSSVENLFHLKEVIGDQETAMSWNRFKPRLPSLTIKVHKENNLNWLG